MVDQPLACMQVGGTPAGYRSAQQRTLVDALQASGHATPAQWLAMERFAFYDRVKSAFAIVHTGELQPWAIAAGLLLVKEAGGMVGPVREGEDILGKGAVIAANEALFEPFCKTLRG